MATIGNTQRPAYVYDQESDTWIPIGVGPHSHEQYIDKTSITGKGDLIVGTAEDTTGILVADVDGKYLVTDSAEPTGLAWVDVDALPDQTGNDGKYLTTDGSTASWVEVDALPDQSGQDGKYLTTDGTTASWSAVDSGGDPTPQIFLMMGA